MLELHSHERAGFFTFTYEDQFLPPDGALRKKDFQDFMKRLRERIEPVRIRFFAVGEYGDKTARPHYHAMLYGLGPEDFEVVQKCWPWGHIHVGEVTKESCQYVAGYVTKKMMNKDDPRLKGRPPEFVLCSRRPGLGAAAADAIGKSLTRSSGGALWVAREGDVPKVTRVEGGFMPLGRYMVGKIRLAVGMEDEKSPPAKLEEFKTKMSAMRVAVGENAFKAGVGIVDWEKADKVLARAARSARFGKKVF